MTIEEFKNEQNNIDEEVKRIAEQLNAEVVYDGVISPEHYLLAPIKTSWVLREPHDSGGGYDYKADIIEKISRKGIGRNKYFDPMRYLEYSLKNNLVLYDDIPDSDKDVTVSKLLLHTAFTNINKIVGGASVNWDIFPNYIDKFSGLVKRQFTIADPKIIIASGTIDFFNRHGYLSNASVHAKTYRKYYASENNVILDCYHLSQHTISQEAFCNDIINALKDAKLKGFLN
jgi:hypothetical protein